MSGFESRAAVRDKIEWEGGIVEALDYGLNAADMPEGDDALIKAWDEMETKWRELQPLVQAVERLLDAAGEGEAST